jgi:multiple sugar transport system ATP-binding protein
MAEVELRQISKVYPGGVAAVRDVSLTIADREFVVLVGPSGCGKSTLLRMVAGLETATQGEIRIGGRLVNDVAPKDRDIAMVFQSYALYPHLSVYRNMALGLELRKMPRDEIRGRVEEAAEILGVTDLLDRKPRQLSGGQRQRIAVGRAIVRKPQVFLFDEPLSNLDAKKRVQTRGELIQLHRRLQATILYVTHDQTEAMTMGNRIVVMAEGQIQQVGSPLEVYRRPASRFVAGFIGSPAMNFVRGRWTPQGANAVLQCAGGAVVECLDGHGLALPSGDEVELGVRPEHVAYGERPAAWRRAARSEGTVAFVEPLGSETLVHTQLGNGTLVARIPQDIELRTGERLTLWFDLGRCHVFTPGTGARIAT